MAEVVNIASKCRQTVRSEQDGSTVRLASENAVAGLLARLQGTLAPGPPEPMAGNGWRADQSKFISELSTANNVHTHNGLHVVTATRRSEILVCADVADELACKYASEYFD